MTTQEAIQWFEEWLSDYYDIYLPDDLTAEIANMAISALRAQQEREHPQPLTLDELREMRYGWVWAISNDTDLTVSGWAYIAETRAITIWEYKPDSIVGNVQLRWEDYGKTWIAFRHKPEAYDG